MAVRKLQGRYAVEFELRGHRVFRRLPSGATKGQAEALEARLRHELIDQAVLGKRPNVTIEHAINTWLAEAVAGRKSEKGTKSHANRVIAALRDLGNSASRSGLPMHDLQHVAAKIAGHDGLAPGTINRRLCVLKAVAKFAWRKGWTEENLSPRIQLLPEKKYQRREVTPEDARNLIASANTPRAKALIAFSAYTGMRLGEVLKLKPSDIRGDTLVLRDTKNGMDRILPILPELKPHLKQLPFGANWRNVYRGFESARKRAKLDIRYHDLRHMVGTALHEAGRSQRTIMDILGHKSIQTSARYIHPSEKANREALEAALGGLATPISIPSAKRRKGAKKAA